MSWESVLKKILELYEVMLCGGDQRWRGIQSHGPSKHPVFAAVYHYLYSVFSWGTHRRTIPAIMCILLGVTC